MCFYHLVPMVRRGFDAVRNVTASCRIPLRILAYDTGQATAASIEQSLDYCVVEMPRWLTTQQPVD
jgi:carbamoylphosphate synthase large subunit